MKGGDWFIVALCCCEYAASVTYLFHNQDWKQAIVWGGVAVSNTAYLLMSRA